MFVCHPDASLQECVASRLQELMKDFGYVCVYIYMYICICVCCEVKTIPLSTSSLVKWCRFKQMYHIDALPHAESCRVFGPFKFYRMNQPGKLPKAKFAKQLKQQPAAICSRRVPILSDDLTTRLRNRIQRSAIHWKNGTKQNQIDPWARSAQSCARFGPRQCL